MSKRQSPDRSEQDDWDYEHAEVRPGVKSARTVVSVAFGRDDFERVAEAAERDGLRISQFVREAALARTYGHMGLAGLASYSSSPGLAVFTAHPFPSTRVSAPVTQDLPRPLQVTTGG